MAKTLTEQHFPKGFLTLFLLGFFQDCLPHLKEAPKLEGDIQFCVDAEVDTLDLRSRDIQAVLELKSLVSLVLNDNFFSQGNSFSLPDHFPAYLAKVQLLNALIDEIIQPSSNE